MTSTAKSIAIVVCSTRKPRACMQIATFVENVVRVSSTPHHIITILDLQDWNLPMFDEPGIPSQIHDPEQYEHEHTRAWSHEIARHDAFVFVTPQYNWGYPAVLKNAIDYLFNEWKGKAAVVISYGGHCGNKCNAQLREVLAGLDMRLTTTAPALSFPSRSVLVKAAKGQDLGLDSEAEDSMWCTEKATIAAAYEELTTLLET